MRYLFVTDEFFPEFGANSIIIASISKQLVQMGNEVYVLPFNYNTCNDRFEKWGNIHIYRIINRDDRQTLIKMLKSCKYLAAYRILYNYIVYKFTGNKNLYSNNRIVAELQLEEFIKSNKIDVSISICCSYELSLPFFYLKQNNKLHCKWIFYMLDPFATHSFYLKYYNENKLKKLQHKLMKTADAVIMTDLIKAELVKWESKEILKKSYALGFPKIINHKIVHAQDDIKLNDDYFNIVYVGACNVNVRNPYWTLEFCKYLKGTNIKLHIVGSEWREFVQNIDQYNGNLILHGALSHQACINAELNADALLNIGNSISNQMPSKILEYISTGKPIINFYKLENCPSHDYLRKYPIVLNIKEFQYPLKSTVNNVKKFINDNRGKKVEFDYIEKTYYENTVLHITSKIIQISKEITQNAGHN